MNIYKTCVKCKEYLSADSFNKDRSRKDGLNMMCRSCHRKYKQRNKDQVLQYAAKYRINNPEKMRQYSRNYMANNPHCATANNAKRRAAKQNRTPVWLTPKHKSDIQEMYEQARIMTQQTGIPHEVDHIEPLQGKDVSGLHVPWNLQVIPASENRSLQNKRKD